MADDHTLMREGLTSLLEKDEGLRVVAEARDGREAVRLATELRPDVVIMDVGMPELNGIEATRKVLEESPDSRVIALSMHVERRLVMEALRAGASAYVLKLSAFDELRQAVQAVLQGNRYLSPAITDVVLDGVFGKDHAVDTAFTTLSPREREVLQLLAEGSSSKQIAERLGISPRTVDVHRKNIMDKLQMHSVAELTRYAVREGLVSVDH